MAGRPRMSSKVPRYGTRSKQSKSGRPSLGFGVRSRGSKTKKPGGSRRRKGRKKN